MLDSRSTSLRRTALRCLFCLFLAPGAALAQASAVIDEGTMMVTRKGSPIGRESFRIARTPAPGGQVFLATGDGTLDGMRVITRMGTDSAGVPVSYEATLSRRGEVIQRLQGRGRPGRFSVLVQTRNGESAREYLLSDGALLLDEEVFHHFFFVPLTTPSEVTVIVPRATSQDRFRLQERGTEVVEIAGRSIPGRHFALIGPNGATRDVWVDSKGRLLKVAIPERGLVALRDDPPR